LQRQSDQREVSPASPGEGLQQESAGLGQSARLSLHVPATNLASSDRIAQERYRGSVGAATSRKCCRSTRFAGITQSGRRRVDAPRERIGRAIFETWAAHDVEELVRLMRKFADAVTGDLPSVA
jgi:hypothetical protein